MFGKVFKVGFGWKLNEEGKVVFQGNEEFGSKLLEQLNGIIEEDPDRFSWDSITMEELGGLMFFVDAECDDVDDPEEGMDWDDQSGLAVMLEEFINDVGRTEDSEKFYYLGAIWRRDDTHYWKV